MTLAELLARCPNILLDFDGPVCAVFTSLTSEEVSRRLYERLQQAGAPLPDELPPMDPFDLLHRIKSVQPQLSSLAEATLSELELQAVHGAQPTPQVVEMMGALADAGHRVVIVSNNGVAAIEDFLDKQSLRSCITGISARTGPDPDLLKPNPHLLLQAASQLSVELSSCVLVGDSVTDVLAARSADARSIAFANKPHKRNSLRDAVPDWLISDLTELVAAL